jgi:wyosine [tRNA(Phe)-imidazoG37] synthetase (radical SAM superfamily)
VTDRDQLSSEDHGRRAHERSLVYPVLSRRAGGLSVGVNLNPGQECNWACVYCEVEGLVRGAPGAIDLDALRSELESTLAEALTGRWAAEGESARESIKDVSIAGDGEPTLSPCFADAVAVCAEGRAAHGLDESAALVTITNGSRAHVDEVAEGLRRLGDADGEAWFKIDGGSPGSRERVNRVAIGDQRVVDNLVRTTGLTRTWIQTMVLAMDGREPADEEVDATVDLVQRALDAGATPAGVLVYGLARKSHQPDAHRISAVSRSRLSEIAARFERLELPVRLFP